MKKRNGWAFAVGALMSVWVWAQQPGAIHLWYTVPTGGGDMIVNRVRATDVAPNTYYEVLGWNAGGEAGGYTGIQFGSARNMIFSIWDPSNGQPIGIVYQEPGSRSNRFTGEGTGLHWDNTPIGDTWNLGSWYSFVCRAWPVAATGRTQFAMWTLDESQGRWSHHVTMDYPIANQRFAFGLNSFLELWAGYDPALRNVEFRDAWLRRMIGPWVTVCGNGTVTDGGLNNPPSGVLACGGVASGSIFLRTGAQYQANANLGVPLPIGARFSYPAAVVFAGGGYFDPVAGSYAVSWNIDPAASPQWRYTLEVFRTPDTAGSPIVTREAIDPHARSVMFSAAELPDGHYWGRVRVRDIFDQDSLPVVFEFTRAAVEVAYLSDLPWLSSANGWGPSERDRSNGEAGSADGHVLAIGGEIYAKGVGCHAASSITLYLGTVYSEFISDIGVDDEVGNNGSVVFKIYRDGIEAFASPTMTGASIASRVRVDVRNVDQLRLEVSSAGDGIGSDHADWAGAALVATACRSSCRADFNCSGGLPTVQDILDYLIAYFAGNSRADFNSTGGISLQDIFDFLAAYFESC